MSRIFGDSDIDTFTNLVVRDTAIFDGRVTFNGEVDVCAEFVGETLVDGTLQGTTFLAPGHEFAGNLYSGGDMEVAGGRTLKLSGFNPPYGPLELLTGGGPDIYFGWQNPITDAEGYRVNANVGGGADFGLEFSGKTGTGDSFQPIAHIASTKGSLNVFGRTGRSGIQVLDLVQAQELQARGDLSVSNDAYIEGTTVFGTDTPNAGNFVDMISKKGGTHLITPNGIYTDSPAPGTIALSSYVYDHQVQSKMVHTITLGAANGSTEFTYWVSAAITVPFEHTFVVENYSPSAGILSFNMLESGPTIPGTPYFGIVYANPQVAAYQNQVNISLRGKTGGNPVGRTILRVTYAPTASASFGKSILYIEVLV